MRSVFLWIQLFPSVSWGLPDIVKVAKLRGEERNPYLVLLVILKKKSVVNILYDAETLINLKSEAESTEHL